MSLHKLILSHLQDLSLSLAELQQLTQVSLPTLRKAIQELSDAQWIRVTGQSESNGGRPAMLFGLDNSRYAVMSVHIQLPGIRFVATDLTGQVLHEQVVFEQTVPRPYETIQEIETYLTNFCADYPNRIVLGVGISSPGYTDPDSGSILTIGRVTGWQNFPICNLLQTALGLPVYIANDIDCMAFAEFQHSQTPLTKNLMYVGFDEGVKISLFLNGQLHKGAFGNAGLITSRFHTPPDILTIKGINSLFDDTASPANTIQRAIFDIRDSRQRVQAIFESSLNDDFICKTITNSVVQALVKSIVVTTYLIHPDIIVVGGILSMTPTGVYQQIESGIYDELPILFANHLRIQQAVLSEPNRAAIGASHHFLQTYLADPITDPLAPTLA